MNDTETSMNEHNDRLNVELYPMEPPPHEKYVSYQLIESCFVFSKRKINKMCLFSHDKH
jgi:hypothetical protein